MKKPHALDCSCDICMTPCGWCGERVRARNLREHYRSCERRKELDRHYRKSELSDTEIRAMRLHGDTLGRIARHAGLSRQRMRQICIRLGIP